MRDQVFVFSLSSLSLSLSLSLSERFCENRFPQMREACTRPIMRIALSLMARRRQEGSETLAGGGGEAAA